MILSQLSLVSAALIAAQQAAEPQPEAAQPTPGEITQEQASDLKSECGERRFEASADVPRDGKVRRTRITLCAKDSDTDREWLSKLEKAAEQVEAHPTFPRATKEKLLGDLRAEIDRVKALRPSFDLAMPIEREGVPAAAGIASEAPIPAPQRQVQKSPLADFNALPPLPRGPAPAPVAAPVAQAAVPARRGPQLTVRCVRMGDYRSQPCGIIMPDERLVVRATEPFDGPVSLRFTREDSGPSAEVPIATRKLSAGQTGRIRIPKEMCAARFRARFTIQAVSPVINGGRSGERLGSFEVRCDMG